MQLSSVVPAAKPGATSEALRYAGDLTPVEAWRILSEQVEAVLVDVRTDAEWRYVGEPDLRAANKVALQISWQCFPDMHQSLDFVDTVRAHGIREHQPLLLLCRSGVRSRQAAHALTAAGFSCCFNIEEGFEGDKDGRAHRSSVNGWKVRGLPWRQG
ncbi:MAG: rhodanese-like domain-containing protein [Pseudomonadota bacterium]